MSKTVVPQSTAISLALGMARSSRYRPPPKGNHSIEEISANSWIWPPWVWRRSLRLRTRPSALLRHPDRSGDEFATEFQERRSQAVHRRPRPDADPDILL